MDAIPMALRDVGCVHVAMEALSNASEDEAAVALFRLMP